MDLYDSLEIPRWKQLRHLSPAPPPPPFSPHPPPPPPPAITPISLITSHPDTADAEIKVPSAENPELELSTVIPVTVKSGVSYIQLLMVLSTAQNSAVLILCRFSFSALFGNNFSSFLHARTVWLKHSLVLWSVTVIVSGVSQAQCGLNSHLFSGRLPL